MKELEGFTDKDLRMAERVIKTLNENNITEKQLSEINIISVASAEIEDSLNENTGARRKRSTKNDIRRPSRAKARTVPLLKPGETETMDGVICEKCRESVYIEGVCGKDKIIKQGFTRRGLCGSCGNEFLVR